jgi:hypothetical protein
MGQSKGVILCHHKGCSSMVLSADIRWETLIQLEEKDFMDVSFLSLFPFGPLSISGNII